MVFGRARPLDPAKRLEPVVAHPRVHGRQAAALVPHLLGARAAPVLAQPGGERADDVDVCAGTLRWPQRRPEPLHAPLARSDGALGLESGDGGRQHHVRQLRGLREEDVLDDEVVEPVEQPDGPVVVGLRLGRVLTEDVEGPEVATLHRVEHLGEVPAALGGERDPPASFEPGADGAVLHVLEPGELVGQRTHVPTSLDVVLAPQRDQPGAEASDVAREQGEVAEREDVVGRGVVLGDPERPAQLRPASPRVVVRQARDRVGGHAGQALALCKGEGLDGRGVLLEARGGPLHELGVHEAGPDDLPAQRVGQGDVGADVDAQPDVGPLRRSGAAGVDGVHLRPVAEPLQQVVEEDRVRFPRVRPPEDDQVGLLDLPVGAGAASGTEDCRQTGDARCVSGAVAGVDVVRPHDRAGELLREEVHLVARLRAAEHPEFLAATPGEAGGGPVQGLVPGSRAEGSVLPDERLRQSGVMTRHRVLLLSGDRHRARAPDVSPGRAPQAGPGCERRAGARDAGASSGPHPRQVESRRATS